KWDSPVLMASAAAAVPRRMQVIAPGDIPAARHVDVGANSCDYMQRMVLPLRGIQEHNQCTVANCTLCALKTHNCAVRQTFQKEYAALQKMASESSAIEMRAVYPSQQTTSGCDE